MTDDRGPDWRKLIKVIGEVGVRSGKRNPFRARMRVQTMTACPVGFMDDVPTAFRLHVGSVDDSPQVVVDLDTAEVAALRNAIDAYLALVHF